MKITPCEHRIQYYETDQMGIVHHSNYIRWFEEARMDFLEKVGTPYSRMETAGFISPVISVECRYRSMAKFGETVQIYLQIRSFNGVRLALDYEVRDRETGEIRCTGSSMHCYLDEKGRPVNLKRKAPEFYELYRKAEELEFETGE